MEQFESHWRNYTRTLEAALDTLMADPAMADPKLREAALYLPVQLQAVAFHLYVAPNKRYPLLYQHSIFSLTELNWGLPNPDYSYRFGFLDGKQTYRITAPHKSPASWFNMHMLTGWWGDELMKELANIELNDLADAGGRISFTLGADADADVRLDPGFDNIVLNIRESQEDWSAETLTPLRIERVSPAPAGGIALREAELCERIDRAARFVTGTVDRTLRNYSRILASAGGENVFFTDLPGGERANNAANLSQTMMNCIYRVEPGEALIIETQIPKARYWGIQLGDCWWRTVDYAHHQSSLNRKNAWFGADGVFRAVLSHEDPGIQNWLDPVDNDSGQILIRLNQAHSIPLPTTKLVPVEDIRDHLPVETPAFTADQRAAQIATRRDAALRRYGF